jgi:DNA-binding NtrC family response regulator
MSTLSLHPHPEPAIGTATKRYSEPQLDLPPERPEILGESAVMQRLRTQVKRLGPYFRTVLLRGESGTGKELIARALHGFSSHAAGPFVIFRPSEGEDKLCAAMKAAHRGTLYLHRIDRAPAGAQSDLLETLKSRERSRQSRIVVHGLEARIIASTTEDLRVLAASGRFRQELYARLATMEFQLSPLRERVEDIPLLAKYFLEQHARHDGRRVSLSEEALERMQEYRWPGNVRELKEQMRRAVAGTDGRMIEVGHVALPGAQQEPESVAAKGGSTRLQEVVEQHVFQVLKGCAGNKVKAAELLGISRSTLYRMLESGLQADKVVGLR